MPEWGTEDFKLWLASAVMVPVLGWLGVHYACGVFSALRTGKISFALDGEDEEIYRHERGPLGFGFAYLASIFYALAGFGGCAYFVYRLATWKGRRFRNRAGLRNAAIWH